MDFLAQSHCLIDDGMPNARQISENHLCTHNNGVVHVQTHHKWKHNTPNSKIFVQSISNDGTYKGYDLDMINFVLKNTHTPIIPCGGCSSFKEFEKIMTCKIDNIDEI